MRKYTALRANDLRDTCYQAAKNAGWQTNTKTGEPFTMEEQWERFPMRVALIHSEVSEAMECHRKDLMDDHLPHRKMVEVELADALIRIFDTAGAMGLDIGGALAEKLEYNATRADHKLENRASPGGKAY